MKFYVYIDVTYHPLKHWKLRAGKVNFTTLEVRRIFNRKLKELKVKSKRLELLNIYTNTVENLI